MFTIEVRSDHNVTTGRQAALQEGTVCCTQLHKSGGKTQSFDNEGRAARPGLNGLGASVLNSICPPLIKSP